MRLQKWILVLIAGLALAQSANAQDHWVTTFAAAPQQPRGGGPPAPLRGGPGATPEAAGQRGQAAPAPQGRGAIAPAPTNFNDQTIRMIARTSLSGRRVRVTLSNAYGTTPLKIGAAHVALRSKESEIV